MAGTVCEAAHARHRGVALACRAVTGPLLASARMQTGRGQVLLWAAAAVLGTLAVVRMLDGGGGGGQGAPLPVSVDRGGAAAPADGAGVAGRSGGGGAGAVYVHVAGRVRRPGLYRLPAGSRVATALERAGGPAHGASLAAVNLAARVEDGQQILVPGAGAAAASGLGGAAGDATGPGGAAGSGSAGRAMLSLAAATVEQLDQLDGIGPTLAKRIVQYRDAHGGFRSVDELNQVEGIGQKRLEALREAVGP
jgi:competence protein ComEA